jgi:hypothetical protein
MRQISPNDHRRHQVTHQWSASLLPANIPLSLPFSARCQVFSANSSTEDVFKSARYVKRRADDCVADDLEAFEVELDWGPSGALLWIAQAYRTMQGR